EPTGPELGGVAPLPELVDPQQQLGDFRLKREIGRGGMGVVYEAEQISIARTVAVKVVPFAALAGHTTLRRFQNEVRAAALLDHPHIVAVYSVGEERGIHYYAMKLVRGRSLADVIQQMRDANGRGTSPNENEDNLPLEGIGGESTLRFQAGAT